MEEILIDLVQILLPASLVLFAIYLTVNSFLTKEFEKKVLDLRMKNSEVVLPVRLQAYERILIYLERIAPQTLVRRLNQPSVSSLQLQQQMLSNIREEYNHNVAQQLYLSESAWVQVKHATEEVIGLINLSAGDVDKEAPGIELAKAILERQLNRQDDPVARTMSYLKREISQVF